MSLIVDEARRLNPYATWVKILYTSESLDVRIKNPQDRLETVYGEYPSR
jgi:hypothetical protein